MKRRSTAWLAALALLVPTTSLAASASAAPLPGEPQTSIYTFADGVSRLSGQNRYETAITTSTRFAPNVPALFVSTGENFPDALSAASAAAQVGGPLLLTPTASVPQAVLDEARRLAPQTIYVIGGTGAVSDQVANALQAVAPVERLGGANRYETGLNIVKKFFPATTQAFVATGASYPDALAATGAAGAKKAPVVLIDGTQNALAGETVKALQGLGATTLSIAGGTGVVSSGIENQLKSLGITVNRFGGADRYQTATLINDHFFPAGSTNTMFLATGQNFPDALSGAALAGYLGAPLFITPQPCVTTMIQASINKLNAPKRIVMGGTGAVSVTAAQNQVCPADPKPAQKNCQDFKSQADAQAFYLKWKPQYGDFSHLDDDNDGVACESQFPTSSSQTTTPPTEAKPADKDCKDFKTQAEAQAFYLKWKPQYGDFAHLDADNNGIACESLK